MFDLESFGKFACGHFAPITHSAPFGEQSNDSFRADSCAAIGGQTAIAMSFGQASAIGSDDQWQVPIVWHSLDAKSVIEKALARGGCEQVVAADDMRDSLGRIIANDGQLVGRLRLLGENQKVAHFRLDVRGEFSEPLIGIRDIGVGDTQSPSRRRSIDLTVVDGLRM